LAFLSVGQFFWSPDKVIAQDDSRLRFAVACANEALSNDERIAACNALISPNPRDPAAYNTSAYNERGIAWFKKAECRCGVLN
jgi:hypothetical protein